MEQFYAYIEDNNGSKIDISDKIFFALNQEYSSYSSILITEDNFEGKLSTNVYNIVCYGNKLSQIEAPNARFIDCSDNLLERVNAPNCERIFYEDNPLLERNDMILSPDYQEENQVKQYKR